MVSTIAIEGCKEIEEEGTKSVLYVEIIVCNRRKTESENKKR